MRYGTSSQGKWWSTGRVSLISGVATLIAWLWSVGLAVGAWGWADYQTGFLQSSDLPSLPTSTWVIWGLSMLVSMFWLWSLRQKSRWYLLHAILTVIVAAAWIPVGFFRAVDMTLGDIFYVRPDWGDLAFYFSCSLFSFSCGIALMWAVKWELVRTSHK